eukprot:jgi/Ulvmu1/9976/UM059_0025.1
MPRELITIQVGQCGNQIGCRFWDLAVKEHKLHNASGKYDETISSFFKNVDSRSEQPLLLRCGTGNQPIANLKARAIVVDMEEGVINAMLKSPLGSLFDARSMLADTSGAGNNWAHGHHVYGPQYHEHILQLVRQEVEQCDSLQGFVLTHSLGGGTGSGLGTYLLSLLQDLYPDIFRFSVSLFPSEDDDVVTSPYNGLLSLSELVDHADAVLPIENQALHDIVAGVDRQLGKASSRSAAQDSVDLLGRGKKPYDRMNNVAASVMLNLTSGMRFPGMLNVDINDITMNMVPFPRHHFLIPAMSPLVTARGVPNGSQRGIDRMFHDILTREHQLLRCYPRNSTYLACGLLARGKITSADVSRNLSVLQPTMKMAYWNQEGFKVGLCSQAPLDVQHSLLCLANNCCVSSTFDAMIQRFDQLFSRRVYVHHYSQFMDPGDMAQARENVFGLMRSYQDLDGQQAPDHLDKYESRGLSFGTR